MCVCFDTYQYEKYSTAKKLTTKKNRFFKSKHLKEDGNKKLQSESDYILIITKCKYNNILSCF